MTTKQKPLVFFCILLFNCQLFW